MALDFDTYKAQQFCDNPDCDASGKVAGFSVLLFCLGIMRVSAFYLMQSHKNQ